MPDGAEGETAMKFVHLSDLHLGKRVNEFSMLEDQRYILRRILQILEQERPEAVMIAGDIYDKPIPPAEAVTMFDDFLVRLAHMSLQDANGLTKAINISTNLASLTVYLLHGQVLIPLGLLAGICGIAGNYLGVSFFDSRGSKIVRPVMLSVLVIFMCRTIYDILSA